MKTQDDSAEDIQMKNQQQQEQQGERDRLIDPLPPLLNPMSELRCPRRRSKLPLKHQVQKNGTEAYIMFPFHL